MGMVTFVRKLWEEEEGQDLTEYALLVVLLALAAIVGMNQLAGAINNVFSAAGSNLTVNT
jgi:pilus assembly protein Flp/PilA